MNQDRIDAERADMERRVANFRDMQAKFQRDRDVYYERTLARVRSASTEAIEPDDRLRWARASTEFIDRP